MWYDDIAMSNADDTHVRRATFDDVPELYDRARPVAPSGVLDDLVELAGLEPGARLVEIGCGTGQATEPLAERGFEIVAVELGEHMADFARRKLAAFPSVKIVTSSFEDWDPAGERFDAVVSFNAFHWVDPEIRYAKPAAMLRDGGALAVFGSAYVEHDHADPVWMALQEDYEAVTGEIEPRLHVDALRDRSDEFREGGHFGDVTVRRYRWDIPFDADAYVGLVNTQSWHRTLADDARQELFTRIHRRIQAAPGQTISPTMAAVLYVARRA
jgi:SAM-dependent methyltransferase